MAGDKWLEARVLGAGPAVDCWVGPELQASSKSACRATRIGAESGLRCLRAMGCCARELYLSGLADSSRKGQGRPGQRSVTVNLCLSTAAGPFSE